MTETKSAPLAIETKTKNEAILTAPIGLGLAVGQLGSFPCKLRCPVQGLEKKDYPVAIFHLYPWDLALSKELADEGVEPMPNISGVVEQHDQGIVACQKIIDVEKGWENLIRFDGSEWKYKPPKDDAAGTRRDPRVQLAAVGSFFNMVKALAVQLAFAHAEKIEGNSETSSEITTDEVAPYVENHPAFKSE